MTAQLVYHTTEIPVVDQGEGPGRLRAHASAKAQLHVVANSFGTLAIFTLF